MPYTVYHKDTTRYLKNHPGVKTNNTRFETRSAAKAALTREIKNTKDSKKPILREDFLIVDEWYFTEVIEKTETVINLMSGKPVQQPVNTPRCCNPGTELYWSM